MANETLTADGKLSAYLTKPEAEQSGDETNVADFKITQSLIAFLGYSSRTMRYNQKKQNLHADFVVQFDEYPDRACFIADDESPAQERLVSHRSQLQAYMGQYTVPRRLLCHWEAIHRTVAIQEEISSELEALFDGNQHAPIQ